MPRNSSPTPVPATAPSPAPVPPATLASVIADMRLRIQQIMKERESFVAQVNKQLGAYDGELTTLKQTIAKLEVLDG